jgi:hypothetical protein
VRQRQLSGIGGRRRPYHSFSHCHCHVHVRVRHFPRDLLSKAYCDCHWRRYGCDWNEGNIALSESSLLRLVIAVYVVAVMLCYAIVRLGEIESERVSSEDKLG